MTAKTQPLIVAVAPNGAYKTQHDHPQTPLTASALARTATDCLAAGACMMHLHVRDASGRHTLDAEIYHRVCKQIQQAVGDQLSIQVTSEAAGIYTPAEQMAAVRTIRPRSVSIALREVLLPGKTNEKEVADFFIWLSQELILPQYILYSADELHHYAALRARGIIPDTPHWLLFVLGRYSQNQQSDPDHLHVFLKALPEFDVPWAVCAFGQTELACTRLAASMGGHVRIGFENNLHLQNGAIAEDNAALITQFCQMQDSQRALANAARFRELFQGWG